MADGRSDKYHLTEQQGTVILFLKNFVDDVRNGFLKFRGEIADDPDIRRMVLDWFDENNIISDNKLKLKNL